MPLILGNLMAPLELATLLGRVLQDLTPDTRKLAHNSSVIYLRNANDTLQVDESLEKLRFFFPETLLLGALDLIDRDSGRPPLPSPAFICIHRTQSSLVVSSHLVQDPLGSSAVRSSRIDSHVRRVPRAAVHDDGDGVLHMSCLRVLSLAVRNADDGASTTSVVEVLADERMN